MNAARVITLHSSFLLASSLLQYYGIPSYYTALTVYCNLVLREWHLPYNSTAAALLHTVIRHESAHNPRNAFTVAASPPKATSASIIPVLYCTNLCVPVYVPRACLRRRALVVATSCLSVPRNYMSSFLQACEQRRRQSQHTRLEI